MNAQLERSSTISSGDLPQNESLLDLASGQILINQFKSELSEQRILSYLTTSISESSPSFIPYKQFKEATVTFIKSERTPVVRLPDSPSKDKFVSLQKWEGIVIEVKKDIFLARLHDLTKENPEEEAEFPLEEISPEDKKLLQPGAIFYWNIGYLDSRTGQRKRESIIRFRRIPAWREEEIEVAKQEAQALLKLISEVDSLSFEKNGETETRFKKQRLDDIISKSLSQLESDIKEKGINIRKEYEDNLPSVLIDIDQMTEAISNIFSDSVKRIEKRGEIRIGAKLIENDIQLLISDNGSGIPEENIAKIFKPYFTTKRAGRGMGLAIARKIINMHMGKVSVKSKEGEGTTFTIRLPAEVK